MNWQFKKITVSFLNNSVQYFFGENINLRQAKEHIQTGLFVYGAGLGEEGQTNKVCSGFVLL